MKEALRKEIADGLKVVKIYQTLDLSDFQIHGKRKRTDARLDLILQSLDPSGKKILDIGCSNGFFCYELAKRGGRVTGVDKNSEVLALNRKIAHFYEWDIDFVDALLDGAFLDNLEKYDAILFLSVLHHIFNNSLKRPIEVCREIMTKLSKITDVLVFEIGQSGEPFPWSRKLALMEPDPKTWILKNLFDGTGFSDITVLDPPAFTHGKLAKFRRWLWSLHRRWTVLPPKNYLRKAVSYLLVRVFIYDPRDTRYIFVARK